jgi:serine/threonine protein phosphatase PrpC
VIPLAEIQTDTIYAGDQLFVCCDGIVEHMENEDACAVISEVFCGCIEEWYVW